MFLPWFSGFFQYFKTTECQHFRGPLYNSIFGVQTNFRFSYWNCDISGVKCIGYIGKGVWNNHLQPNGDPCYIQNHVGLVKRICVFEHSVMSNFNCACPAIQRGQGSGFLSEGSSWLTACMSEQQRFWRDCADAQARLNLCCSHRR